MQAAGHCGEGEESYNYVIVPLLKNVSSCDWAEEGRKAMEGLRGRLAWLGLLLASAEEEMHMSGVGVAGLVFSVVGVGVPILNLTLVTCPHCPDAQQQPFRTLLDLSETTLSALSFSSLLFLLYKHGLPQLLLLPDVCLYDPLPVQHGYLRDLQNVFHFLAKILLPFFMVELVHNVLWFINASVYLPFSMGNQATNIKKIIMCCLSLGAWVYNNSTFLLMCLLFKLMCSLQVLRLQSYYDLLESPETPSVLLILQEHMRLREQLLLISHRFRLFLVLTLFAITLSQFAILFKVTASGGIVNFARTGDLVVCCAVQLVGFIICLHAAAKITHMAQRIVAIVSQWHAVASCADVDEDVDDHAVSTRMDYHNAPNISPEILEGGLHGVTRFRFETIRPLVLMEGDEESDLNASLQLFHSTKDSLGNSSYSFHKRHALVTYLQHCNAGISVYGFVLDRGCLYTIFAMELSIMLWTLGKTLI